VAAAEANRFQHFVYVSVAHPAPAMKAYIEVRSRCEEIIRASGLNTTILRPWYVLGPGHYWPLAETGLLGSTKNSCAEARRGKTRPGHAATNDLCAEICGGVVRNRHPHR
jgi:uncharacterized protein YbjT (DUF2867 family)